MDVMDLAELVQVDAEVISGLLNAFSAMFAGQTVADLTLAIRAQDEASESMLTVLRERVDMLKDNTYQLVTSLATESVSSDIKAV